MSPDDIDRIALGLHDLLVLDLGCDLSENQDWDILLEYIHEALEPYVTRDRNYN
jgi:hypothetical protein